MTEPVAAYNGPVMWAEGSNLILSVHAPEGLLYQQTFPMAVFSAVIAGDGEIIRFTYDWTDPEDGQVTRGAARLVLQQLPDPRDQKTEEQPTTPAEATATNARARERCQKCRKPFSTQDSSLQHADMPFCKECADRCHDTEIADHWCAVDQWRMDQHTAPADATACTSNCDGSDMCTGDARYIERPSGPPVRVDGPGCTPAMVPHHDTGEMVHPDGLYSDKCAECTTGASCEDAGRCLFEG